MPSHDERYQAVDSSAGFLLIYSIGFAPGCVESDCSVGKRDNFTLWL